MEIIKFYKNIKLFKANFKKISFNYFLVKILYKNKFINYFLKYNLLALFKYNFKKISVFIITNQCIITDNKKQFNKFSYYSRYIFFKKIRNGIIGGLIKYSWSMSLAQYG